MRKLHLSVFILFLLIFNTITGCSNVKQAQPVHEPIVFTDHALFGEKPEIISEDEIFHLSHKQQKAFLRYFNNGNNRNIAAHRRVYNYLKHIVSDFNYQGNTYTAEEAIRLTSGNCLSLAIITTALARLAGVDIGYQLIDDSPVYEQMGRVIFKGVHVRSVLYFTETDLGRPKYTIGRTNLKVDYFPSGNERFIKYISEPEYVSMYYRNKAAEAIAEEDYSTAYWLVNTSLEFAPDNAQAINMMAIIYHQAYDDMRAEEIYKYGIEYVNDKLTLLKNYRILLNEQGRYDEAEKISDKIASYDDPSPFNIMHMADKEYNNGNYSMAIHYYKKATELAPYLHEGYFGLAKSYYQLGNIGAARHNMHNAVEHAFKMSTKSLYQAKLTVLSQNQQSRY